MKIVRFRIPELLQNLRLLLVQPVVKTILKTSAVYVALALASLLFVTIFAGLTHLNESSSVVGAAVGGAWTNGLFILAFPLWQFADYRNGGFSFLPLFPLILPFWFARSVRPSRPSLILLLPLVATLQTVLYFYAGLVDLSSLSWQMSAAFISTLEAAACTIVIAVFRRQLGIDSWLLRDLKGLVALIKI